MSARHVTSTAGYGQDLERQAAHERVLIKAGLSRSDAREYAKEYAEAARAERAIFMPKTVAAAKHEVTPETRSIRT